MVSQSQPQMTQILTRQTCLVRKAQLLPILIRNESSTKEHDRQDRIKGSLLLLLVTVLSDFTDKLFLNLPCKRRLFLKHLYYWLSVVLRLKERRTRASMPMRWFLFFHFEVPVGKDHGSDLGTQIPSSLPVCFTR